MSDQDIRRELTENLERYESNAVLNKLTPNRRTASDLSHRLSRSSSRRTTPGRLGRRLGHNDSNIVTSPVKTLRRYRSNTAEDEDEDGRPGEQRGMGYDVPEEQHQKEPLKDNITFNVPLKDSPKEPMRKGTPKALSAKSSKKELPIATGTTPLNPQTTKNKTFTLFGDILTLPASASKKKKSIQDDEYDDGIENDDYSHANDTLLSDIPNDLLSPEKHIYPKDNITRNPTTLTETTSSPRKSSANSLSKSSLYPDLSAPQSTSKSKVSTPSSIAPTANTIQPLQASTVTLQATTLKPVSPIKPSNATQPHQSSPFLQLLSKSPTQTRTQSQPPPIYRSPPPVLPTLSSPRRTTKRQSTPDSPLRSPARRLPATSTSLSQSNNVNGNGNGSTDRRIGSLDLAQFESSDEEPVPELTVPINMNDIQDESTVMTKRVADEDLDVGVKKRRFSIYPDLPDGERTQDDSAKSDVVNHSILKDVQLKSLYPSLLSPVANRLPVQPDKEIESQQGELGDADHWVSAQWARFIDRFEKFEETGHDFSVFDDEVLEFLKCDRKEILLKIGFYKAFKEDN